MNGLEKRYAAHLDLLKLGGEIVHWEFEPLRFRLADGAWYKPDFFVVRALVAKGLGFELHETKGRWMEAARVRIKVSADRHPFFKFRAVQWNRTEKVWEVEEF
jgi:hypothetical protein